MNLRRSIWQRLLGCLVALVMLVVSFPTSAFALQANVNAIKFNFGLEDGNLSTTNVPDSTATGKLKGHVLAKDWQVSSDNTIDLWIYSEDMTPEEQNSGSTVPYVIDGAKQKWVLKEIYISNDQEPGGDGNSALLMTSDQIENAASLQDYVVSTSNINFDPDVPYPEVASDYSLYYVWYIWGLADAVEDLTTYNVSYDLNFPTGATTLYPVWNGGGIGVAESNGSKGDVESVLKDLSSTIYSNQDYTVSDFPDNKPYGDFIAFTYDSDYGHDYFDFDGWTVKGKDESIVYKIGQSIPGDQLASLADDNGNITFVAKWSSIKNWTNTELEEAANSLTLNAVRGVDTQTPLITQSVNGADATGNAVTLKEGDTISYTVQTQLGGILGDSSDPKGMTTLNDFATFTYRVTVDQNLEFVDADQDGQVTLTLDADNLVLTDSNISGAEISADQKTITFDPDSVTKAEDGRMNISVTMEWRSGTKLLDSNKPITLRGLVFKVKDSAIDSYGVVPEIKTYANVTGSINLHNKASAWRSYYQSVANFLTLADWNKYFNLDTDRHNYPAAVVHASQLIDYKLKNFDLSTDPTATLEDNTVVANSADDKISYPALDKKVQGAGDTEWVDTGITAPAGEEVSFQLNSNVPQDLLNYITPDEADTPVVLSTLDSVPAETVRGSYPLVIHDQMADKLALDPDSFVVKLGNTELTNGTEYSVQIPGTESESSCTFEILIDLAQLYENGKITVDDIQNASPITVTYTATLADDVAAGTYQNTAWVTYPKGESSQDTVAVDTFGIKIFKYDQSTATGENDTWTATGLSGAHFKLYQKNGDEEVIVNDDLTSDKDGYASVQGLDVGTYYLKETDAPDGYICSDEEVMITISTGDNSDAGDDNIVNVKFANSKVPHTGGTGTVMYTVGGLAIIVLAGILLVVYRKSRKKQDR